MKDYIVMVQDLLAGRNEEFDTADRKRVRLIRHKDSRKEKNIGGKIYRKSSPIHVDFLFADRVRQ